MHLVGAIDMLRTPSQPCRKPMPIIRFISLAALVIFTAAMGSIPMNESNWIAKASSPFFFIFAPALYFFPTYEAWRQNHQNLTSIGLLNLFLGWTLVGWVIAIVWAFKKKETTRPTSSHTPMEWAPLPSPASMTESQRDGALSHVQKAPEQAKKHKKCPFCAEDVLAEAIKCKHCKSDLPTEPAAT